MKALVSKRTKGAFAAHGRSGKAAHWIGRTCPAEQIGDYRCVDDGFVHDSAIKNELLILAEQHRDGRRPLSREESAAVIDSVISLASLGSLVIEHLGAYAAKEGRCDELPLVTRRPSAPSGFVVRLRGCTPYRKRVRETLSALGGIGVTHLG